MKTEALIIHLVRAKSRKTQVDHIRVSLSIPSHVVSAVDGQDLSDEEVRRFFRPRLMRPRYPFTLGRNEIACFLSHRKCWQLILEKQLDFGLVIEDDVNIDSSKLSALIDFNVRNARPTDFVRFPKSLHNERGPEVAHEDGMVQIEPLLPGLGMQMQLVGRKAARDLLEATQWFDRPVDAFIQMQWRHNTRVLSARPKAISEKSDALGGTTVQKRKRGIADRIRHEFLRPAYRTYIRASNLRWRNGKDAEGLVDNLIVVEANRYGLGQDARLLADVLRDLGQSALVAGHKDRSRFSQKRVARRIIHLERVFPSWFSAGLETTLIPNPEWFRPRLVSQLQHVDRILAKTDHGAEVFSRLGPPVFQLGFASIDCLNSEITKDWSAFFHLAGGSFLKGTEEVLSAWRRHPEWPQLTLMQSVGEEWKDLPPNVTLIREHLPTQALREKQNYHGVHLCPSRAEGWGHYIHEAQSCGAVVVTTDAPPMNEFVTHQNGYLVSWERKEKRKLGDLFFVSQSALEQSIAEILVLRDDEKAEIGRRARIRYEATAADFRLAAKQLFYLGRKPP